MKTDAWRAPYSGFAYFFTHPGLWGWAILGTLITGTLTIYACAKTFAWTFPAAHNGWTGYFWHTLQSLGWALFTLVLMVAIVFPLIFNACFARGFCNQLKKDKEAFVEEGFAAAFVSSFWVFFRTLKWRLLWPLILLATILFLPFLIFPVSLIAANHLAVIESADLVLSLHGMKGGERVIWLKKNSSGCFAFGISGAILSFLLSLTGVGWIFWIPAIYCGAFLWARQK